MFITRERTPELSFSESLNLQPVLVFLTLYMEPLGQSFCSAGDWLPTGFIGDALAFLIPFLSAHLWAVTSLQYNDSIQLFQAVLNIGAKLGRDTCQMINNVFCLGRRAYYWFNNSCCLKWRIHSTGKCCFTLYTHQAYLAVPVCLTKKGCLYDNCNSFPKSST